MNGRVTDSAANLKHEFDRFDRDGSGSIDEAEFGELLTALGLGFSQEKAMVAFLAIDINGNGRIDFGEFETWWKKHIAP